MNKNAPQREYVKNLIKNNKLELNRELIAKYFMWLSYIPTKEQEILKLLSAQPNYALTQSDLKKLKKAQKQVKQSEMFLRYLRNKASKKDYLAIYDFINQFSIEKILLKKLTKEETEYAENEINKYYLDLEKRDNYILKQNNNYLNLSATEAYILHRLEKEVFESNLIQFNNLLLEEILRNSTTRVKSHQKLLSSKKSITL